VILGESSKSRFYKSAIHPERWEIVRHRIYQKRICDLGLKIKGSGLEPLIHQLKEEIETHDILYMPNFYLTDTWGCPDRVPIIGIPFYLSSPVLGLIEKEQTGELEDRRTIMQLLRHEAGHAINYAFRLWELHEWKKVFGAFSKPYREAYHPNPWSRKFVRHIRSCSYGYTYAQKHPDDDFAETFAVWLTPRSGWRRKYRDWPALEKLKYVDRLMEQIRDQKPVCKGGKRILPLSELTMTLAEHYRNRFKKYGKTS
jgi:hypothetical protein